MRLRRSRWMVVALVVAAAAAATGSARSDDPEIGIGTAHPILLEAYDRGGRWAVVCQAREDTDKDGAIRVVSGHHGAPSDELVRPYLVEGSGPGHRRVRRLGSLRPLDRFSR
jgi:hypothetical protein